MNGRIAGLGVGMLASAFVLAGLAFSVPRSLWASDSGCAALLLAGSALALCVLPRLDPERSAFSSLLGVPGAYLFLLFACAGAALASALLAQNRIAWIFIGLWQGLAFLAWAVSRPGMSIVEPLLLTEEDALLEQWLARLAHLKTLSDDVQIRTILTDLHTALRQASTDAFGLSLQENQQLGQLVERLDRELLEHDPASFQAHVRALRNLLQQREQKVFQLHQSSSGIKI